MSKEELDTSIWGEKPQELKPLLRFTEANGFSVVVTIPANKKAVRLFTMEGDFGESKMAEFPEGVLNINSVRLRSVINKEFIGIEHKIKIARSGEGYNTQYKTEGIKEEKPPKSPKKASEQ